MMMIVVDRHEIMVARFAVRALILARAVYWEHRSEYPRISMIDLHIINDSTKKARRGRTETVRSCIPTSLFIFIVIQRVCPTLIVY